MTHTNAADDSGLYTRIKKTTPYRWARYLYANSKQGLNIPSSGHILIEPFSSINSFLGVIQGQAFNKGDDSGEGEICCLLNLTKLLDLV